MYHQKYHKKSQEVFDTIENKYPFLFDGELSNESIEVRYYLLEYLSGEYDYRGKLEKDEAGKPIPISISGGIQLYWSVSHSENYVAFIVSEHPTGIDIAELEDRDPSLLESHSMSDYDILGGKNWNNFYILWTAKESIIKQNGGKLDDIGDIHLEQVITPTVFEYSYNNQNYWVYSIQENNIFLSYIIS